MKIYIAGKITGDRHYKKKFCKAEKKLAKLGHSPVSPAWLKAYKEIQYIDYMLITNTMQKICEATLFLKDWKESNGAKKEYEWAKANNQIIYFDFNDIPKKSPS